MTTTAPRRVSSECLCAGTREREWRKKHNSCFASANEIFTGGPASRRALLPREGLRAASRRATAFLAGPLSLVDDQPRLGRDRGPGRRHRHPGQRRTRRRVQRRARRVLVARRGRAAARARRRMEQGRHRSCRSATAARVAADGCALAAAPTARPLLPAATIRLLAAAATPRRATTAPAATCPAAAAAAAADAVAHLVVFARTAATTTASAERDGSSDAAHTSRASLRAPSDGAPATLSATATRLVVRRAVAAATERDYFQAIFSALLRRVRTAATERHDHRATRPYRAQQAARGRDARSEGGHGRRAPSACRPQPRGRRRARRVPAAPLFLFCSLSRARVRKFSSTTTPAARLFPRRHRHARAERALLLVPRAASSSLPSRAVTTTPRFENDSFDDLDDFDSELIDAIIVNAERKAQSEYPALFSFSRARRAQFPREMSVSHRTIRAAPYLSTSQARRTSCRTALSLSLADHH